ncbi:MAG: porin [Chitinophagaceae bacterium]|nr:porin [Chitinophagaceae bacterium]
MLQKFVATASVCLFSTVLLAQEDSTKKETPSPLKITGFADVYYRYDFGKTAGNNKTSFTNAHNSFELGMASIKLEKSFGKVGVVADLGFGKRAKEFAYNDDGITQAVKQLYVTYAASDKLTFTAGSWATHVGYELVDAPLNRNYSMSYMFSYGPFTHTGIKADYKFGSSGIMLGISNPTDYRTTSVSPKYIIGQFSTATADGKLKLFANYVGGRSSDTTKMNQYDLVLTYGVSDKFSLGYNGTIARYKQKENGKYSEAKNWWGSALYFNFDPTEKLGFTLRSEYFEDNDKINVFGGVPGIKGGSVFANTLSANVRLGSLTLIPEFRLESGSTSIFTNGKGNGSKTAAAALLAAVYSF